MITSNYSVNSHGTDGENCVEIWKKMHVKFFPLGAPAPNRTVTVNRWYGRFYIMPLKSLWRRSQHEFAKHLKNILFSKGKQNIEFPWISENLEFSKNTAIAVYGTVISRILVKIKEQKITKNKEKYKIRFLSFRFKRRHFPFFLFSQILSRFWKFFE